MMMNWQFGMETKFFKKYVRFTNQWSERLNWISVLSIAAMLIVQVIDIIGGKLFSWAIPGSMDIIGLLGLLAAAFAIGRTEILKQHVRADFLIIALKERSRGIVGAVSSFLSLLLFALVIWRFFAYGIKMQLSNVSSPTLRIPFFPFGYAIALACIPLFLVILIELFESIRKGMKK